MAIVLVTGTGGRVGGAIAPFLEEAGWKVRPFDLADGDDLRDEAAVLKAASGCSAIVHAGAVSHDTAGTPAEIMATNVLGTWHVLLAAQARQAGRVVYFSSAQVFGIAEGEGEPDYLPIDDDHPLRAGRPYGLSKRLTEEMCASWSGRSGIPTVALRPVMILGDERLRHMSESTAERGAYVHIDDVVNAASLALTASLPLHTRLLLCGPGPFDTSRADQVLGWRAMRGWPEPI